MAKKAKDELVEEEFAFEVEDGIPVPPIRQKSKYPWERVGSGQTVLVPESAESSARSWLKLHRPEWICVRRSHDTPEGKIRLWFYSPEDAMAAGLLNPETGEAVDDEVE